MAELMHLVVDNYNELVDSTKGKHLNSKITRLYRAKFTLNRSHGGLLAVDVEPVAGRHHLSGLPLFRQVVRTQIHGQQETIPAQGSSHRLQFCPSDFQYFSCLPGE